MRGLLVRKTRNSLTQTGMVTFERRVLSPSSEVKFSTVAQEYRYPNGSVIAVGGLDNPVKIMSGEYDLIISIETTELTIDDWESLSTRLRNGVVPYQQMIGDCNPQAPKHWIKVREKSGALRLFRSEHQDNPTLYDRRTKTWTEKGSAYISKLAALTGVRGLRLREGLWVAAEGAIYTDYRYDFHVIDRFRIPDSWPRIWTVDFGFVDPFVWQNWAIGPDKEMILDQEIYMTERLVEDHARQILRVARGPKPVDVITDHDAEDRATLERHLGMITTPAYKAITPGIQNVQKRLRKKANGRTGIWIMRDALVETDPNLSDRKAPTSTPDEIEGYVWDPKVPDQPAPKQPDHGLDCTRYAAAWVDDLKDHQGQAEHGPAIY